MAVTVNGQGSAFEAGAARPLFEARPRLAGYVGYGTGHPYDVSTDGQKFLINTAVGQTTSAPITLVFNWTAGLNK